MGARPSLPSDTTISLAGKGYTTLPFSVTERHPVICLNLSGNRLQALPRKLARLKSLVLDSNAYTKLPKKVEEALLSYPNLTTLSLNRNRLTTLPLILKKLEVLNLSSNDFIEFPAMAPRLTSLSLDFNRISRLSFCSENLRILNLVQNDIEEIDSSIRMPNLQTLDLSLNKIRHLPDNLPEMFPQLKTLILSFNYLTTIDVPFPSHLQDFDISFNEIEELPAARISQLAELRSLRLEKNNVAKIPKLPGTIETINFAFNRVEEVEAADLRGSGKMVRPVVLGNRLKNLPKWKCDCEEYILTYNRITTLRSPSFSQSARIIDIGYCGLREVPKELFSLPRLRKLFLYGNNLRAIPPEFAESSISILDIADNHITTLPQFPKTLEALYAAGNAIESIDGLYSNCVLLQIIDLSSNMLQKIPDNPMATELLLSQNSITRVENIYNRLRYLDLSLNDISELPDEIAVECLTSMDLSHNKITTMCPVSSPKLQFYKISGNPISGTINLTDCHFLDTIDVVGTSVDDVITGNYPREILHSSTEEQAQPWKRIVTSREKSGYAEMMGSRVEMEDAIIVRDDLDMYAVCDGHGGSYTATFAVHELMHQKQLLPNVSIDGIKNMIEETNRAVNRRQMQDGATLAMAIVSKNQIFIAHMGDARVVVVRKDGSVRYATEDHKPSQKDEIQRIRESGGYVSHMRVCGCLAVSRGFGDSSIAGVGHEPEVVAIPVEADDKYVVIACDGVYDVMTNERIGALAKSIDNPVDMAYTIRNVVFSCGSQDNISVVVRSLS